MVTVVWVLIQEIFLGMIGKVAGKVVAERFATRLVVYGLNKLKDNSENTVVQETVDDVINKLKGNKLSVIDDG